MRLYLISGIARIWHQFLHCGGYTFIGICDEHGVPLIIHESQYTEIVEKDKGEIESKKKDQKQPFEVPPFNTFTRSNTITLGRNRKKEVEKINKKLRNVLKMYERKGYCYVLISLALLLPTIITIFLFLQSKNIKYEP